MYGNVLLALIKRGQFTIIFSKFVQSLKTSKGKTRGFGRLFWNLPDTSQQFKILSRLNFWLELALIWAELALWPGSKAELIWLYN